ncbi:MAG: DEAD/DEAH box helicase family protein, partial [Burkholderiales bacterium]|nr:DEAD/DEAH box helicase family protein [Burkholderiales bacterium]
MSIEEWQRALRRQFGVEQRFQIENTGEEPVFSEFRVTNPISKNSYRGAIRGSEPGDNFCSCPDFATNTLGTCKHVEFMLATLARRRGGKSALKAGFQPAYSEMFLQYGARREIRFRPARACPPELVQLAGDFFAPDGRLLPEKYTAFDRFLSGARRLDHELRCYDDVLAFLAEVRDAERRRERIERVFPQGVHSAAFENLLKISMYDYQREGALFAARAGRSLIGDEMGLGKTIQALAAAEIMAHELGVDRVLVICPTSLKHQWEREIARFVERTVAVIGGLQARRAEQFGTASFFKIMNYDTVHSDLDLIQAWSPDLVILDEAQRIKNW